jgi:hypothetical protein
MQKIPSIIRSVFLDSTGEVSKQKFMGSFQVKVVTTNADKLAIEREYSLLVPIDEHLSPDNKLLASTIAELKVRVLTGPNWFSDAINGQNMLDVNPLYELIIKINEEYKKWQEELAKIGSSGDQTHVVDAKLP